MSLKIDSEFRNLIPPLTKEEYQQLEENLVKDGCYDALIVWNNTIIDGHNRYEICTRRKIHFDVKEHPFNNRGEAIEWIIRNQFGRRNLTLYQKSELALLLKPIFQEKARQNMLAAQKNKSSSAFQNSGKQIKTDKELAKIAGISHDTIYKVGQIQQRASEDIKQKVKSGEISINRGYETLKPKVETQKPITSLPKQEPPRVYDGKNSIDFSFLRDEPEQSKEHSEFNELLDKTIETAALMKQLKDSICVPIVADFLSKTLKMKLAEYPDTVENANNPDRKAFVNIFNILKKIIREGN